MPEILEKITSAPQSDNAEYELSEELIHEAILHFIELALAYRTWRAGKAMPPQLLEWVMRLFSTRNTSLNWSPAEDFGLLTGVTKDLCRNRSKLREQQRNATLLYVVDRLMRAREEFARRSDRTKAGWRSVVEAVCAEAGLQPRPQELEAMLSACHLDEERRGWRAWATTLVGTLVHLSSRQIESICTQASLADRLRMPFGAYATERAVVEYGKIVLDNRLAKTATASAPSWASLKVFDEETGRALDRHMLERLCRTMGPLVHAIEESSSSDAAFAASGIRLSRGIRLLEGALQVTRPSPSPSGGGAPNGFLERSRRLVRNFIEMGAHRAEAVGVAERLFASLCKELDASAIDSARTMRCELREALGLEDDGSLFPDGAGVPDLARDARGGER